ncbi:MAG: RNA polymerase sigma factor [Alphaproteobacteria bacterium]|nr:RNA polymerase sigma factor [Alphaproteobacteria bacterium]
MNTDDNALAERAAGGDPVAFQSLLERHYDTIYRVAYRFTGLRQDAEDLTQDICASLPARLRSFRGEARFTSWLYRVVVNAAQDLRRKQASAGRANAAYGEIAELEREQAADTERDIAWLYETLEQLGGDLRNTAILVVAEGLSHAEAASVLNIKESTVSWRMHELRKRLKAQVEQEA